MSKHIPGTVPHQRSSGVQGINATGINKIGGNGYALYTPKLEAQFDNLEFLRSLSDAAYELVSSSRADLGASEGRLARVRATPAQGVTADELTAAIAEAEHDESRARAAYNAAVARSRATNKALSTARDHLLRTQELSKKTPVPRTFNPKPIKGDPDEVIARVDAEIRKVKAAPRPQQEVEDEAVADLDRKAGEAKVRVSVGKMVTIGFPVVRINAEPATNEIPHTYDLRPWLARFHRDELVKDIRAAVAAKYIGCELALSAKAKATHLAELAAERLNADHIRCAAIWDRHAADPNALAFPADADPRAILGIDAPAPRKDRDEDRDWA